MADMEKVTLIAATFLVLGCAEATKMVADSPETVAKNFTEANLKRALSTRDTFYCAADQAFLATGQDSMSNDVSMYIKLMGERTTIKGATATSLTDSRATVTVTMEVPDIDTSGGLLQSVEALGNLAEGDYLTTESENELELHWEQDRWCVYGNLEHHAKLSDLTLQARQAETDAIGADNKLEANKKAAALWKKLLDLDAANETAMAGLEKAVANVEVETAAIAYIPNVEILNFEARRIDTWREKNIPAVRFGIKNAGDQTLTEVKVLVEFQDRSGQVFFEKTYHPILVNRYSNESPLKPNHQRGMDTPDTWYTLKDMPSDEWNGKATAQVVSVELGERES